MIEILTQPQAMHLLCRVEAAPAPTFSAGAPPPIGRAVAGSSGRGLGDSDLWNGRQCQPSGLMIGHNTRTVTYSVTDDG